jgi:hypothetical protein
MHHFGRAAREFSEVRSHYRKPACPQGRRHAVRCCACRASAAPGAGPARRPARSFRTAATRERRKAASHRGSITQDELERLGIAAIKKGTNRHDIVRAALNNYFRKLSAEFPHPCACMEGGLTALARHAESNGRADHPSYPACAEDLDSANGDDEDRREQVVM